MAIRAGMSLLEMIAQLTRGFVKSTGRQPGGLEKIKIKQEAVQRFKDMNKVVDMQGRTLDPSKIIMGGTQEGAALKSGIMKATGAKPIEARVDISKYIKDGKPDNDKLNALVDRDMILKEEADSLATTGRNYERFQKILAERKNIREIIEDVRNMFPEKKAGGGRTGLSYLLAEDINERVPFKMGRRAFLKLMGGVGAGIGALKTGALKLFGKEGATVAKEVTQVPIGNPPGMPSWFKPLVNRVIKEGEQMKVTERERVITHKSQLPESKTDIYVNQDLSTGDVWVDIGAAKHGFPDGKHGQPVRLEYKASEEIPLKGGKGSVRTTDEFNVEEAEFTGGHPENVKFEESVIEKFGDHASDFSEVEEFATGLKKGKGGSGHMASGGLARMLGE